MSSTIGGRRVAPALVALVTALIAALALAPGAFARPNAKVTSFKYDPTDATHHRLIFSGTNTGTNIGSLGWDTFYLELTQTTKISNAMLTVGTTQYPGVCVGVNGGWPVVKCTPPTTLLTPGTSFTITFTTSTVYPAGSTSMWWADDHSGPNVGTFVGPS
jgi:hypothetical protein